MSKDEYQSISADGAPPGVYTSNMSEADAERWKAKLVGTRSGNHQIEIRSTKPGSNLLVVVNGKMPTAEKARTGGHGGHTWSHPIRENQPDAVKMSANGPLFFDSTTLTELTQAVNEAWAVLVRLDMEATRAETLKAIRAGQHPLEVA
jgi:hypothetical protein